jgi:hypothetical protein
MQHRNLTTPVPVLPAGTGGLVPWAYALDRMTKEHRRAFPDNIDGAYCLDAPEWMPTGSHVCHRCGASFTNR